MVNWHIHGLSGGDYHEYLGHLEAVLLAEPIFVHDDSIVDSSCDLSDMNELFQLCNHFQLQSFLT